MLPVAITGTEHLHRGLPRLRRTDLTVRFGAPLAFPLCSRPDRVERAAATDRIMAHLSGLLPAGYRGVYEGVAPESVARVG